MASQTDLKVVRVPGWTLAAAEEIAHRESLTRGEVMRMLIRRGLNDYHRDRPQHGR